MPTPPPRSDEDRRAALERAQEVRTVRAALFADLQAGRIGLAEVFARAEEDDIVATTKITKVLHALPNIGKVRSNRTMEEIGISEHRRVRGVGRLQREALLARFGREDPS